ncbi:MAG: hypothetical protein GY936_14525 [Ignavibacteriae bacterium]|nr:hypothetical protein [Ignavibacteriota bacterium]
MNNIFLLNVKHLNIFHVFYILLLMISSRIISQNSQVDHRVYLTSNYVDIIEDGKFKTNLINTLTANDEPFTLIINGDLIDSNFKKNYRLDSVRIKNLLTEISKIENGKTIIIPGDRDWDDSGKKGLKNVKKLEKLIKSLELDNVKWAIKKGCPGPKTIKLNENLLLVTINTQWWNHPYSNPKPADANCNISTTDDFKEEFEDILNENPDKNIIIAGHFPIISNGEYGGHSPFYKHIFPLTDFVDGLYLPLPFLGSFYPSFRKNIGTRKDIVNERFDEIRKLLKDMIAQFRSLVYVSGHEKNQQIIETNENYFINSGAPETAEYSSNIDGSVLSESEPGIIELTYLSDGEVNSTFHNYNSSKNLPIKLTLFESACKYPEKNLPINYSFVPCLDMKSTNEKMPQKHFGTVKVVAGSEYAAGSFKRFFYGDHYRTSWTAEVEIPFLDLDSTNGGLTALKKGGGRQTKSLKFMGGNGIKYTFRSVNKDPIKALDFDLRETAIADVVKDQTTTQHPYGAMAADILLNELDIIHAHPKLYIMPNDPKLGPFQKSFGNMLGMLEENPANPKNGKTGYKGASIILRSHKLFRKLYKDHDNKVDVKNFAVARAFDILVGDWGKHDDNWKWIGFESGEKTIYKPMPRDRDHVFSRWDGVLPWLADREWAKESGENFDYEISGLRSLMFQARHLDRFIAAELSKKDWMDAVHFVQQNITDQIIERAIRNMPKEIYELSGKEIEDKLKVRIKDLHKYVKEYYEMIALEVDVVGSAKKEFFNAKHIKDGSVEVNVYNIVNKNDKGDDLLYSRTFYPDETNEIRLYGLGGKDIFSIEGNSDESIKVRIIGGPDTDKIIDKSNSKTLIYDKGKKTKIVKGTNAELISPYNKSLYNYNRTAFTYNTYFPLPVISYNSDDGFIFGLGIDFVNHNFDKIDYSSKHNIKASFSTTESISAEYSGRFHHVFGGWDFLLDGHYNDPVRYFYFYGHGNETVNDENLFNNNYYRTRYNSKGVSIGLAYDYWKKSSLQFHVKYKNNEPQIDTAGSIFSSEYFLGLDKINLIEGTINLDLDFRNHSTFPTSGIRLFANYNNSIVTNNNNSNYWKVFAFIESYNSFDALLPTTIGIKAGGGDSNGEIPFYNHFTLGNNNFLRGFKKNRFSGTSVLFLQTELQLSLFKISEAFVPLKFGLLGFFDTGRVFHTGESSNKWHGSYGFGLYVVPLREDFTIRTTFEFSKEESLLFQFGIGTAL